mmetsp:Transcript_10413/g.25550  ORF Transcript_10413/g.25550 Transcript_10413/m.25550 type:complete len:289 (+) Transcript_10413:236-1102(+)
MPGVLDRATWGSRTCPTFLSVPRGDLEHAAGHVKFAGELLYLLAKRRDIWAVSGGEVVLEVLKLGALGLRSAVDGDLNALVNEVRHAHEVRLKHAAGGHGGGADADAARDERRGVAGHRVFVEGDVRHVEHRLHARAVDAFRAKVAQHEVVVGAAGHQLVVKLHKARRQRGAVLDHLLLVRHKLGSGGLLERNRQRADGVVVGAALQPGEHRLVDLLLVLLLVEDHTAAGAAQGLVRGGGDDVGVQEGVGHQVGGNEARDVRHVGHEVCAHLVANLAHTLVVVVARVR